MQTEILVTGGTGMVGRHLKELLPNATYVGSEYDLRSVQDVKAMFEHYRPKRVVHLAAKVGGIMDNINKPVQFFEDNLLINTNTLSEAYVFGVERFIAILSKIGRAHV